MCRGSCSSDGFMRSQISATFAFDLTIEIQSCHCEASVSMIAYEVVVSWLVVQSDNSIF